MLADMDDRVRAELLLDPPIGREVVMGQRQVGVVIDRDGVLPEATRRLHEEHDIARLNCGTDDLALGVA